MKATTPLLIASLLISTPAWPDDVTASEKLLCSASRIIACFEDGECSELMAEDLDVPQFVVVDTKAKKLTTTKASGQNRSTPIREFGRADGLMFIQGIEQGRAFSVVVHEQSGHLTVAVSRDGLSVSVFGYCTDATNTEI